MPIPSSPASSPHGRTTTERTPLSLPLILSCAGLAGAPKGGVGRGGEKDAALRQSSSHPRPEDTPCRPRSPTSFHDPLFWIGAGAAFAASLVRGFSGFGAGMIFVPVAAACFGPRVAAAVLLIVDSLLVLPLIPRALPRIDWREFLPMAIGSVVTVPLGAWVLLAVDPVPIRWGISVVILVFVMMLASGWRYRGPIRASLSLAVGGLAGFMGGVAQISGPPVLIYWLGREIVSATMRANAIVFFCFSAIATGIAFLLAGIFTAEIMLLVRGLSSGLCARHGARQPVVRKGERSDLSRHRLCRDRLRGADDAADLRLSLRAGLRRR